MGPMEAPGWCLILDPCVMDTVHTPQDLLNSPGRCSQPQVEQKHMTVVAVHGSLQEQVD